MRAEQYIVIGKHDSERNSWIPGGDIRHVCSAHRSERAAWIAAEHHHADLGGCDGSDRLTDVMSRGPKMGSRSTRGWLDENNDREDWYEYEEYLYLPCNYWDAHIFEFHSGGIWAVPK